MSKPKRIMFIGAHESNLEKANKLGLETVNIQKKELINEAQLAQADRTHLLDYEDKTALMPTCEGLAKAYKFDHVLSLTEPGLLPAARVAAALGLPGTSVETVMLLKDKWAMRQRLAVLGISPVAAQWGKNREDLENFARKQGLPMIVKPVEGVGSFGTFAIREHSDLESVWPQMQALGLESFIIEEYLEGPEVSVEAFSFGGRHVFIGLTDKITVGNFVELGHTMPSLLDEQTKSEVCALTERFLEGVGIEDGPSHTEFKLTPDGPRILESHNRIGGDRIARLVETAYGVDMVSLSCGWQPGLVEELEDSPAPRAGAAIRFLSPSPGTVQEISGLEHIQGRGEVVEFSIDAAVGDEVSSLGRSEDRSGYVIAQGKDARAAAAVCERLADQIRIVTRRGNSPADSASATSTRDSAVYEHLAEAMKTPQIIRLRENVYLARFEILKLYSTLAAVRHLLDCGKIEPGDELVDSSSGIYAHALALACNRYGLKCRIVGSQSVDPGLRAQLEILGVDYEQVKPTASLKLDQQQRVSRIREILQESKKTRWMQQYHDEIHYLGYKEFANLIESTVGVERLSLVGGVGSGASTGGTVSYLRDKDPEVKLIGVQPFGSVTFGSQDIDDPEIIIAGMGSGIKFENVRHELYDRIHWVSFEYAKSACIDLLQKNAVFSGLSTGCCYLSGCWEALNNPDRNYLLISADTGHRYVDKVFAQHDEAKDIAGLEPAHAGSLEEVTFPWSFMDWDRRSYHQQGESWR